MGEFVNGKASGLGIYIWHNGEIYQGEWLNGFKHGKGQWTSPSGDMYVG